MAGIIEKALAAGLGVEPGAIAGVVVTMEGTILMSYRLWRGQQLSALISAARRRAFWCDRHQARISFSCHWCATEAFLGHGIRTAAQIIRGVMYG